MNRKYFGWSAWFALICSGVAACSGADLPPEDTASSDQELRKRNRCAGPRDLQCRDDQFCSSRPGKCPGERRFGRCAPRPEACIEIFDPVCGCDGVTYGNSCEAAAAGASVASEGPCDDGGAFCGGIVGIPCPEGQTCVDVPGDGCDPDMGGADCGGVCVDPTGEFCGGIAGFPCPEGQICVDVPGDGCDPDMGGADCGGACVPAPNACAAVLCEEGTECVVTPDGPTCVPVNNPCAAVLCLVGSDCVVQGDQGVCVPVVTCGEVKCAPGDVCCNPVMSICTAPGELCIQ